MNAGSHHGCSAVQASVRSQVRSVQVYSLRGCLQVGPVAQASDRTQAGSGPMGVAEALAVIVPSGHTVSPPACT